MSKLSLSAVALATAFALGACAEIDNLSPTNKRLVYGGGAGAAAGAVVGGVTGGAGGALGGAVIGGALGAGAGYLYDRHEKGKL